MGDSPEPSGPSRAKALLRRMASGLPHAVVEGVVVSLVVALVLAIASPTILSRAVELIPTCDNPVGLRQVPMAWMLLEGLATAEGTPQQGASHDPKTQDQYHAWKVFDGHPRSVWAEARLREPVDDPQEALEQSVAAQDNPLATLAITWDEQQAVDARLVCLLNGAPYDDASYRRADRVRGLEVRTSCDDGAPSVVQLRSQPANDLQLAQDVGVRCDDLVELVMSVQTIFTGETITDPDTGERVPATNRIAVAEVQVFEPDPDRQRGLLTRVTELFGQVAAYLA